MKRFTVRTASGEQLVTAQQLRAMAADGLVTPDDLIQPEGSDRWFAASAVKGLFPTEPVLDLDDDPPPMRPADVAPVRADAAPLAPAEPPVVVVAPAEVPTINVNVKRQGSSLGIASIALGIVAMLLCWLPVLGLITLPLSGLGLVLALAGFIVALTRRGAGVGYPIAGGLLSLVAMIVTISMTSAIVDAVEEVGDEVARRQRERNATNQRAVVPPGALTSDDASGDDPAESSTPTAPTWASALHPVEQGDVRVQVTAARVDQVDVEDQIKFSADEPPSKSKNVLLAISLEITNISETQKVEYSTWAGDDVSFSRDFATLADEHGNTYKRVNFGFTSHPVGRTKRGSIHPGETLTDVIVFERPVDAAMGLRLELPATNFGGTGMLRLEIPRKMIEKGGG